MAKTKEKPSNAEFFSMYDLLTSIDKHLSSIEKSVGVIRQKSEDTNERIRAREKVRKRHGKVSETP